MFIDSILQKRRNDFIISLDWPSTV